MLCTVKNPILDIIQIVKIDLDAEQIIAIGDTTISGDTQGNGISVSSDGIIYFNNQIGLYTIDPITASETLVGTWSFPPGLNFCKPGTMSHSSNEKLYSSFNCQGVVYLAEIDASNANLNSFVPIIRNTNLSNLPIDMATDAIVFSSFDFDFLTGSSYGTIESGFDSISVSGSPQNGLEITSDANSFVLVCDNTSLSTDTDDRVNVTCNDTTIKILSGTVETIFEADDGSEYTTTLSIGDIVIFDSETSTITNNGINPISVIVDGAVVVIPPGESTSLFIPVDHYLGYSAKTITRHNDDDNNDDDNNDDDNNDDDNNDRYSKYEKYMKYFKEHHHDKYSKFVKYLKHFKDNNSEKYSKYFKYAKYYYEKYHHDDDSNNQNNILAQKWTLTNSGEIKSELNGFCLDVEGANPNNGANVIMWPCHGEDNQKWTLTNSGEIKSELNGFCLDVEGANPNNGANVIMWPCHGEDNQKWTLLDSNQISSNLNDKCLSIEDAKKYKKANVEMLTCNAGSSGNTDKSEVLLNDRFEGESKYQVKKIRQLYNPVDKNNEGISDEESHLVEYQIKKIKGESKFKGVKNIPITNQFGDFTVDIKKAYNLLVPSAKSHDSVPSELDEISINHFKCYNAKESKGTPKFEKRNVDLTDQFGSLTMTVYKLSTLCSPVDKNNEGVVNDENYLMCYDLKKIKGEPKFNKVKVFTNNQFGSEKLQADKPKRLCVPSEIISDDPVPDTMPVLSLLGTNPQSVIQNEPYVESGATCLDSPDGNISDNIVITGTVDVSTIGSYQIIYDCTDSSGNDAVQVTRTVNVVDASMPIITLNGDAIVSVNQNNPYTDAGATCEDNADGTIPVDVNGLPVDTTILGTHLVTYDCTDSAGNAATQVTRTVNVVDASMPVITLTGISPTEVGQNNPYTDAGATCEDNADGTIPVDVNGLPVDTTTLGTHLVTYDCTDSAGNAATQVTRTVNVVDVTAPVITLIGGTQSIIQDDPYVELGATCQDNTDGDISSSVIISSNVNTGIAGVYKVTYNCADSAGNAATQVTRTVLVTAPIDVTAPVITLTGNAIVSVNQNNPYTDAGATCEDETDDTIPVDVNGLPVDTTTLGTHLVTYDCTDSAGNAATQVTRTVNVVDASTAPVITLIGISPTEVGQNNPYTDAGATCEDNADGDITTNIVINSNVNTTTLGTYQVTYNCADSAGNAATQVTRTVNVVDQTIPIITLLGNNPISFGLGNVYVEPGATCQDNTDGNISSSVIINSNVNTGAVGSYQVTYDCQDAAGNNAVQVTRTVNILSGATLTVIVETDDSSSGTFDVKIENLTPIDTQSISTGSSFGPVSIVPDTVTYTIIQLPPPSGYITGSSECVIDSISQGSQFTASPGDDVICTATFVASSTGGGDG